MAKVGELLRDGAARLQAAGSESPRLDAELLLGHAIGAGRAVLLANPEAAVGADAAAQFEAGLARRAAGEPVAYIRGMKEFYGLAYSTDPRALIPRPETERLVELAVAEAMRRLTAAPRRKGSPPLRVADVGTGAGTIAVAFGNELRKRRAWAEIDLLATDSSPAALDLARENAVAHALADRIRFAEANLVPSWEIFDLILANLPYIPTDAIDSLPIAASFEPRPALDGGSDGLEVIRGLLAALPRALAEDGVAFIEIGSDQAGTAPAAVVAVLPGWRSAIEPDLAGDPRVMRVERVIEAGARPPGR